MNDVSRPYIILLMRQSSAKFNFVYDNATFHKASTVTHEMGVSSIMHLPCPANVPYS